MNTSGSYNTNNEVKCEKCKSTVRVKALVKLKDRYCCPYCFTTIKINKEKR